jgi:uncharacterized protein (DUF2235 family)
MNHFQEGDRLYMFGFSRGAYTVRAVAALIHMYGLIRAGNEPLVPYAIRMMMAINNLHKSGSDPVSKRRIDDYFKLANQFKAHFGGASCGVHFMGVWDTVSSVGWLENPIHLPFTSSNPDIAIGRHAIAIDERRAFFRTNLWHPAVSEGGPNDVKQVWFSGVHCDVGGGYPEAESGLSKIALEWMIKEARAGGLLLDQTKVDLVLGRAGGGYAVPDPKAVRHESLTLPWWPCEFIPKRHWNWKDGREGHRINLFRTRTIPASSLIHQSVYDRGGYNSRLPPGAVPTS